MDALIIPVYRNEESISDLIGAIKRIRDKSPDLFVTFVVDGSPDNSYLLLSEELKKTGFPSKLVLHSRNFGSFAAIRTGLALTSAENYAVMAADLQEPPELILSFFERLKAREADIVYGVRSGRKDGFIADSLSSAFWAMYRKFIIKEIPVGGVDIFGCSRQVRDQLIKFTEASSSLVGQLFWVGFKKAAVPYQRLPREKGKSAWTFKKKYNYMLDSMFAFTDLPIKALIALGAFGVFASLSVGTIVLVAKLMGLIAVSGYTAIILTIVFFGMINMLGLGIVGTYSHRAYENTKQRPLTIVAEETSFEGD
jgi:polyisoprenyl-phosphate glycosyltransferase